MTFTEAAIEVLRREGKPLHFKKIAEIAIRENLLDHVGKIPEETMADQLSAHCRLPHSDRRVIPVQPGTFALEEWGLDEVLEPGGVLLQAPLDEREGPGLHRRHEPLGPGLAAVRRELVRHRLLRDLADVVEQVLPDGDLGDLLEVKGFSLAPQNLDRGFGERHVHPCPKGMEAVILVPVPCPVNVETP